MIIKICALETKNVIKLLFYFLIFKILDKKPRLKIQFVLLVLYYKNKIKTIITESLQNLNSRKSIRT